MLGFGTELLNHKHNHTISLFHRTETEQMGGAIKSNNFLQNLIFTHAGLLVSDLHEISARLNKKLMGVRRLHKSTPISSVTLKSICVQTHSQKASTSMKHTANDVSSGLYSLKISNGKLF